ncbi:MAG: hypothetical protein KC620_13375 [Myxococcales bacterium]|nr:hypothetical protein [Myxococcales bacterium]
MRDPQDLQDALDDLQHDLGKYIRLPLTMLPADADADAVRAAATTALLRTRRGADGPVSAEQLWLRFCDEADGALDALQGWARLTAAVDRALAWRAALDGRLDRAVLTADLSAVGDAIRALRAELDDG